MSHNNNLSLPRRSWQRLTLSLIGVAIVATIWQLATYHLYHLPAAALSYFTSITNNAFYVIASVIIFMVTGKLIYDAKNTVSSTAITQATQTFSKLEESRRTEIDVEVKEAGKNAPELKPFGANADTE